MMLLWDATKFPRTMKQHEWKEADRWRRVTEKKLKREMKQRFANLVAFGTTHPEINAIYERMVDEIVNPPLLLGPMFADERW